jgi:tRNA pseudouridine38-40 synthase
MSKYAAVIEYDGTGFKGFQAQPGNVRTVQGEITGALEVLQKDYSQFSYAGRTDAGVHAKHQVVSFNTEKVIDFYRFKWKLNCLLPDDIVVKEMRSVSDTFDARKDAKWRQYSYFVVNNNYQSVFLNKYSLFITKELDLEAMRVAADIFLGVKDFASFCNNNLQQGSTIREVIGLKIRKFPGGLLVFRIAASSFLYNMVRIIVGTLLEIGKKERNLDSIDKAFKGKNRMLAGKIVPAKGLFLTNVEY